MKLKSFHIILLIMPFLQGCPYESAVPAGDRENAILRPELEGNWLTNGTQNASRSVIRINGNNEYEIRHYREAPGKIEIIDFYAFIIPINGVKFINVYERNSRYTSGGYLLYKIEVVDNNRLRLMEVNKYRIPQDLNSQAKLQNFLMENAHNREIYSRPVIWERESDTERAFRY